MKRVLIGYSTCWRTRKAFQSAGCDVWTCDIRFYPDPQHMQCDIWEALRERWDMAVLHPTCTYMVTSGAWAFADPDYERHPHGGYHQRVSPDVLTGAARREAREEALDNFRRLLELPFPVAIENPAGSFINTAIRRYDQVIHPYQFGDDASKATGLWLSGLPPFGSDSLRRAAYHSRRQKTLGKPNRQRAKQPVAERVTMVDPIQDVSRYRASHGVAMGFATQPLAVD